MLQLSEKAQRLYDLLFTKVFSLERLKGELASGAYSPDDVSMAGYQYVYDCICDLQDDSWNTPRRPRGTVLPGYCSSHMLEALECLLEHGLDPNVLYDEDTNKSNIMSELRFVENGYIAADSLALLLSHGGNPSIQIDGTSLIRDINTDLLLDLNNQIDRTRFDALVHYWMVLVGYGAKLEDGSESIDMCPGHDVSELKKHRDFYYGAIHSDRSNDHMKICFFSKHTNWEVGRY
ncbi:MAG: hypothetical protein IJX84_12745 [Clostridia bacterium]|nr:hypothetical protein [Clostridia bacterium]